MRKAGIDCAILTTDVGMTFQALEVLRGEGLRITALRCLCDRFYFPVLSIGIMIKLVSEADVVHLMGHWTVINVLSYAVARLLGKRYVVCPAGALSIYGRSRVLKTLFNFLIGKRIIANANGHIAIGENEIGQFKAYGVAADTIVSIPNGINPDDFMAEDVEGFRRRYGLKNFPFILFLGRLHPEKGPDILLTAFSLLDGRFSNIHLVFVGPDNGMLEELRRNVIGYGVSDRVHFIGYLSGTDKSAAYHAATLVVIPSRFEAMSIVVLEAGVCGLPVLLTDQCGFSEIERQNGGAVVPASVEGIKLGLEKLLCDPGRLREMGNINKNYIQENYTWDCAVQKYLDLFRKIHAFNH
ncbi:MAG: glycosyltransferase, partial [Proteobacteria bacterium]|nr:glycosyltransferase [Pseudomonadota bacterium]MBU1569082.1 glycosyltransferase [Pseudomonadota bacterium]